MTIATISYLNEKGELSPQFTSTIPLEILVRGYRVMMMTRLADERMITLQRQGIISFALSSRGEEACAVGAAAALNSEDWIYPQYREVGAIFWRGYTIQEYLHHMFGNREDKTYGRQMPNHFGSRALNVVTVSSPIGTKIPHAAGCAYAMKLQKSPTVAMAIFGEGAASEGDFHAGLNFAAVCKAPTLFLCRNNGYAISTPCSEQYAGANIAMRGEAYGMPAFQIDGNDFFAVYDTVAKARALALSKNTPVLIEALTYRMGAHSTSDDPSAYRQDEEVAPWSLKCPMCRLRLYLEKIGAWNEKMETELVDQISQEITASIAKAKATPRPALRKIVEDVYFEVPESLQMQYHDLKQLFPNE